MTAVVKRFGHSTALDGLDLHVAAGQVHGFLGPNGAGKTTTLRILLGSVRADAGTAAVFGLDPWSNSARLHARMAYVPGDVSLWPGLTGAEVIALLGRLHGRVDSRRRHDLCERFELDPSRRCRAYSRGNRQKVALIAALATRAELLLLDEPTSGLDPLMEDQFRSCVRELRDEGCAILLSSHILSEVEALADQVTIIRQGRVVETGSLGQLRHLQRATISATLDAAPAGLARIEGVHDLVVTDDSSGAHALTAAVDAGSLGEVMQALSSAGLRSLTCEPPSLEDVFLRHYGTHHGA
ncbi:MAG: ABC transporter ATP-binding protein [Actinomycetales bacterium]|nr:ABC transporter ATP-binding protein [Actinomycetales bacterium]